MNESNFIFKIFVILILTVLIFSYTNEGKMGNIEKNHVTKNLNEYVQAEKNSIIERDSYLTSTNIIPINDFNIKWKSLGPYNITGIPNMENFYGSGKINAFAIDNSNPNIMYVGAGLQAIGGPFSSAGIYKTINGGKTWFPVDNGLYNAQITSIILDQSNISILLTSTWSDSISKSPMGIFRSDNGGSSWYPVLNIPASYLYYDNGTIYASTTNGIYVSQNWGLNWSLLKATSTWVTLVKVLNGNIYAGLWNGTELIYQKNISKWYYTTPSTLKEPSPWIMDIAVNPWNNYEQFIVYWRSYQTPDLFYTSDGGKNWSVVENYSGAAQELAYGGNGSTIYMGTDGALYVSYNEGKSFNQLPLYVDVRFIDIEKNGIYVGSDQGLYFSGDNGKTWISVSGGVHSSLLTDVSVSGNTIITAVQDYSPIISYDGGGTWQDLPFAGSEDGTVLINPSNSSYVYTFTGQVPLMLSEDGGHSFFIPKGVPNIPNKLWSNTAIAFDPKNTANIYLATGDGVYFSSNYGTSWIREPWPFTNVSSIAINPENNSMIYLGINYGNGSGKIYYSKDNGSSWLSSSLNNHIPQSIAVDPLNSSIVLASTPYFFVNQNFNGTWNYWGVIYRSSNSGASFSEVQLKMPNLLEWFYTDYGSKIYFIPKTNIAVFASGEGLYISYDAGETWYFIDGNAIPETFTGISLSNNNIYVSTQGEGVIYVPLKSILPHNITFIEKGLPLDTKWSINFNNQTSYSTSNIIEFQAPNGNYSYTVGKVNGYYTQNISGFITINGSDIVINLTFNPYLFMITFFESGLPQGTLWFLNLSNGQHFESMKNSIEFEEPNGSYSYSLASVNKNYSAKEGTFVVNGYNIVINVYFTLITYNVIFLETGLPSGTSWYVVLNNKTQNSTSSQIVFKVPNGTYFYSVYTTDKRYFTSKTSGSISVNGSDVKVSVIFNLLTYKITFNEKNLPSGLQWSVSLNNITISSINSSIEFTEPNGTYSYIIETPISGGTGIQYISPVFSGSVKLNGTDVNINITYEKQFYLTLLTNPSNRGVLSPASGWYNAGSSVKINAISNSNYEFLSWTGTGNGSYTGTNNPASVTMNGPITEQANFIELFHVTFIENGLPSGTTWYVNLSNGQSYSSSSNTITFNEPNGTYSYTVASNNKEYAPTQYSG
ncbi:MAG: InlB B-repeat-containing protein, partial [Thermoplasmata archaeon]